LVRKLAKFKQMQETAVFGLSEMNEKLFNALEYMKILQNYLLPVEKVLKSGLIEWQPDGDHNGNHKKMKTETHLNIQHH